MRIATGRVRRAVWSFVALYAVLAVYAGVSGDSLAAVATELLFGALVLGFGVLLVLRADAVRLVAVGGLLAVGGGLEVAGAVVPTVDRLADAITAVGLGAYLYERWLRKGTPRPDPLDTENA